MLRLVTAIIKPHQLSAVKEGLTTAEVHGLTISEVKGFGRQGGHTETYRGTEYSIDFVPKVKVEVVVAEAQLEGVLQAITDAARTGKIGDGKIWVTTAGEVLRIRTGERGSDAL